MTNSSLTGATYPLNISGKEFSATAFNDKDYDELDNYIQSKIIGIAKKQLGAFSGTERSEFLQAAIKAASSSGWATAEGAKIISTVEGSIRLGWQMVRATSKITFDKFYALAIQEEYLQQNIHEIDIVYGQLNFRGADEGTDTDPKEGSVENTKSE